MVKTALHSPSWHRVSVLRPRLRSHTQIHRHVYRGQVWYVMQDHSNGEFHRYTPEANFIIRLMDGKRSVQEIWEMACEQLPDDALPQQEVIHLMAQLHQADVLVTDSVPDARDLLKRRKQYKWQQIKQYVGNPSSLKIPLLDPHRWLERTLWLVRWIYSWWGGLLWLAVVMAGVVHAAMYWHPLTHNIWDRVFSTGNVLTMALVYPVVKAIHELGHAYTVKIRGGEVHEMGVMFLLMVPIPYVDASASWAFPQRCWRMLVGGAGIMVELFMASVAMMAWTHMEPGLGRSIAYSVVLICGLSTLLMNGNPLLRYDGYYVLADMLDMPNLAQRANTYVGYLIKRYVFFLGEAEPPKTAPGEPFWLIFFAILSFSYRIFIMVFATLIVAKRFFFIGIMIAIWLLISSILMPLWRTFRHLLTDPHIQLHRNRCYILSTLCVVAVILCFAWLPLPDATVTEGVIWVPPQAQIRAGTQGKIVKVPALQGGHVSAGALLFVIDNPEQRKTWRILQAQQDEYQARYRQASANNPVKAGMLRQQWAGLNRQYQVMEKRVQAQHVRAKQSGQFIVSHPGDMIGRMVQRGQLLGYVTSKARRVRIVLDQSSLKGVEGSNVEVRLMQGSPKVIPAKIIRQTPAATDVLPSMVLSLQAGGSVGVDPRKSAQGQARSVHNLFIMDVALNQALPHAWLGGRVLVRFPHTPRSMLAKLYDRGRQLILHQFGV